MQGHPQSEKVEQDTGANRPPVLNQSIARLPGAFGSSDGADSDGGGSGGAAQRAQNMNIASDTPPTTQYNDERSPTPPGFLQLTAAVAEFRQPHGRHHFLEDLLKLPSMALADIWFQNQTQEAFPDRFLNRGCNHDGFYESAFVHDPNEASGASYERTPSPALSMAVGYSNSNRVSAASSARSSVYGGRFQGTRQSAHAYVGGWVELTEAQEASWSTMSIIESEFGSEYGDVENE